MHRRVAILEIDNIHSSLKQRKTMLTSHRRVTTMCLNEHTEKWEPCVVKNSSKKHESSNTPSQEEKTKGEKTNPETTQGENTQGGKVAQESSNNGKAHESSKTEQSSVPVRPAITLTPIRAHITTKANIAEVSKNSKLTEKNPLTEEEIAHANAGGAKLCKAFGVSAADCPKFKATEDCHKTSGGSWLCVPKPTNPTPTVASTPHTGERKVTEEFGPGWRELLPGETCKSGYIFKGGKTFCHEAQIQRPEAQPVSPALHSSVKIGAGIMCKNYKMGAHTAAGLHHMVRTRVCENRFPTR